jgi:hypothetical protein
MPTTKSGNKKTAYQKSTTTGKSGKKGSKSGGGNLVSGDPIIITGGGSVSLDFNNLEFGGIGGKRKNRSADLDKIRIIDPPNPPTVINLSRTAVIHITFK